MIYAVGFVSGMTVTLPFFDSVIKAVQRDGCGVISVMGGPVLHRSRNQLAEMFVSGAGGADCDRMVMVDADIVFTLDDLDRLLAHDEPIVSGIYGDATGEIVTLGCGFMSITKDVLERMLPFPFNPVKTQDGRVSGEDVGFRVHAKEHGYETVVDFDISVGHVKTQIVRVEVPESELALAR